MTDGNIAVQLLGGEQGDAFATAILVSRDSDLTRPMHAVQARYPGTSAAMAFPPDRESSQLRTPVTAGLMGRTTLIEVTRPVDAVKSWRDAGRFYLPTQLR